MQFEQLGRRAGLERLAHPHRPQFPAYARQGQVLEVQPAIEEEGKTRAEAVDVQPARAKQFHIGEPVGQRVSRLLDRRRAGLGNVVAANRDWIPTRHLPGGELHHVRQKA